MNIHRIPEFLRTLHPYCSFAPALFFVLTACLLRAQDGPAALPAAVPGRESLEYEGIRIVFPKGEADVVEHLKPTLRKFREERKRAVEAEAKSIAECLSDTEMREVSRKAVAIFTAREAVSDQFDARWASQAVTMQRLADAWSQWSGGISELQLWRRDELSPADPRRRLWEQEKGRQHQGRGKNNPHAMHFLKHLGA